MMPDMMRSLEMKDFPDVVCSSLRKHVGCEQVVVYLYEYYLQGETRDHVLFWGHSHHKGVKVDAPTRAEIKLRTKAQAAISSPGAEVHSSIVMRVAMTGQPCTVQDMSKHPDAVAQSEQDAVIGHKTVSTLVCPIMIDAKVIGVVQLFNRLDAADPNQQVPFTNNDLDVTLTFAKKVAMSKLRHRQEALCFNQLSRNYTKHLYVRPPQLDNEAQTEHSGTLLTQPQAT